MAQLDQPAELDLTMVVPYFNPGDRLRPTVEALLATLRATALRFEIICVSDGSTDASAATLDGLAGDLVTNLQLEPNQGKGHALQVGLRQGRGRYLGFIDADGDLPPDQLKRFTAVFSEAAPAHPAERRRSPQTPDFIIGTKTHPGAVVRSAPLRRLASWTWQQLVATLFGLDVADTQVGLKLLHREMLHATLPRCVEEGFAFDLELLVVAAHLGYRRQVEIPVVIRARRSSTMSARAAVAMVSSAFRIWWRLHRTQRYGPSRARPAAAPQRTATCETAHPERSRGTHEY